MLQNIPGCRQSLGTSTLFTRPRGVSSGLSVRVIDEAGARAPGMCGHASMQVPSLGGGGAPEVPSGLQHLEGDAVALTA